MKKLASIFLLFGVLVTLFLLFEWKSVLVFFVYSLQVIIIFFAVYQALIGYLGLRKYHPLKLAEPEKKFAVIVAAHNEEAVVGEICENLKRLDYPSKLYDVYVISDNCTDKTAEVVRESGLKVMERFHEEQRGKGYALEWMFDKLWEFEEDGLKYDAVVIFDADNLVSRNFLNVMNTKLQAGYEVVQGYLDSKNPGDSWITKAYAFSYWATNRVYQLSRERLGLSAQIGGTGIMVSTKVLKELGWGATSLTEDLEFTQRYLLKTGKRVSWAHDAKVYDEKPLTFKASWKQRIRWMQGHSYCMFHYTVPLLKKSFEKGKLLYLDSLIYLLKPSRVLLSLLLLTFMVISFIPDIGNGVYVGSFEAVEVILGAVFNKWLIAAVFLAFSVLPFIGLLLEKKYKAVLWVVSTYVFSLSWFPITIIGILKRNEKVWNHTKHTRKVTIDDLEKT